MKLTTKHKYKNSRKKCLDKRNSESLNWKNSKKKQKNTQNHHRNEEETEMRTKRRDIAEDTIRDIKDKHTQHEKVFKMIKVKMTD